MKPRGVILLAAAVFCTTGHAQKSLCASEDEAKSLKVISVFDPMPPSGYAPLIVTAQNKTGAGILWELTTFSRTQGFQRSGEHKGRFVLLTPPLGSQSGVFLAPLTVDYETKGGRSWGNQHEFVLAVESTGTPSRQFHEQHARVKSMLAIAISKSLASGGLTRLNEEVEKRSSLTKTSARMAGAGFGSSFDPADLPEDWRGLSGFDVMMISRPEWQGLKPGQRLAVLQWVRFYGRLDVYAETGASAAGMGLPEGLDAGRRMLSFGTVERVEWNGSSLDAKATVERYWGQFPRSTDLVSDHAAAGGGPGKSAWGLRSLLGTRSFDSWQVVVFLVIFGILVGPVNLFLLAPAGRRHRLFVTTPLLSLGMSLLMLVFVVVQDGIGGMGVRMVLVDVEPAEASAYVTQEQVCRTGVLLGAEFATARPVLMEPLALPDSPWVKLKDKAGSQPPTLSLDGLSRSGTFFQSRVEQAHALRAVVPGRARMELKAGLAAGAAPEIVSSLGFAVDKLFYMDADGAVWKTDHALASGQSAKLSASRVQELRKLVTDQAGIAVGQVQRRLQNLLNDGLPRNGFVATARRAPGLTLDTLPSIDWKEDRVLVFGSLPQP